MEHNTEKLREMIKYITIRSQNDPNFGKTKLYKLVFFADFYAHKNLGTSISGQEYQKNHYGPVSEDIDQVYLDLINSREIAESIMDVFNYVKHRPVVLTKVDTAIFSKEEIFIMDDIIQEYYLMNGKQISNASHDVIPAWEERLNGESIPLSLSLIEPYVPTEEDEKLLDNFAKELESGIYEFCH